MLQFKVTNLQPVTSVMIKFAVRFYSLLYFMIVNHQSIFEIIANVLR